jgi:hypothetical protein
MPIHIVCIFLIIPVMMLLFVYRKDLLSIFILITRIILWRHISIYTNCLPSCQCQSPRKTPQTHLSTFQSRKEKQTNLWCSRNGTGKQRNRILPVATRLMGYTGTGRVTTTPSFSLLHYLAETFIDDYFSDLL